MSEFTDFPTLLSEHHPHTKLLLQAGYASVFDIVQHSRADFVKTVPGVDVLAARHIYLEARQRAESLKSLYRAWQLRQDPILSRLKKISMPPVTQLEEVLKRNIGGDGDFSELMERSSEYADAASIQSLFSPGRYATALYKVATTLHPATSELHIDNRRPDLKKLLLSETTMNQEVTSLDILLDVLQADINNDLGKLATEYFPMTLPYDDDLTQTGVALDAQGRTLNGVWQQLADYQAAALMPASRQHSVIRAAETIDGEKFYLKSDNEMLYLTHPTNGSGQSPGAYLNLGKPNASATAVAPLKLTYMNGKHYLGIFGELTLNDIPLEDAYLLGENGLENGLEGSFARMASPSRSGLRPSRHLSVDILFYNSNVIKLKTSKGYIGSLDGLGADWTHALTVDAQIEDALTFKVCLDEGGTTEVDNPSIIIPSPPAVVVTEPSPPTRNTLSLTPVSYALLVQEKLSEDDISEHYGLNKQLQFKANTTDLVKALNDVDTFCLKTGLKFNQMLMLTAQADYALTATGAKNASLYYLFGKTEPEDVWRYGAAYLNSGLEKIQQPDERLLWVQPETRNSQGVITTPATLNFQADTVTELAGRAEKLVRLQDKTGLSFEMLDWIIANASTAMNFEKPTLDKSVLDALAGCIELKQRYGIEVNTFVSFIGAVNPYAKQQEKSFYESTFLYPDLTKSIRLGGGVKYLSGDGDYEAACCKALGVNADEFSRIGQYCFGNQGTFIMSPETAGQIYRFGAIPRMLGMTFAEAECLWQLMGNATNNLLVSLGSNKGLSALDIIQRTEQVLFWMANCGLTLIQVQAMVTRQFSGTATAEMFTFLQSVYQSVTKNPSSSRTLDAGQRQHMLRTMAGGLGIKTNIMSVLSDWLSAITSFTLDAYWQEIDALFGDGKATIETLQQHNDLVISTQQLSQLVLISNWLTLTEQDLELLVTTPAQLDANLTATPSPDLPLLLLLTRFKRWQMQVTVSRDEALRLLPQLIAADAEAVAVAQKIATIHDCNADTVQSLSAALFDSARPWPQDFAQLWQLLNWLRTAQALNIGTATLIDLQTMMRSEASAEAPDLISRVARNLSAGISQR